MPALAPVPAPLLKKILELAGYRTISEDALNWLLVRGPEELPITLPRRGTLVAVEVMMNALHKAGIDNAAYFALREQALGGGAPISTTLN